MELNVALEYGPLKAEFQGEDRSEIQDNLIEFVEFLDEHEEVFSSIDIIANGIVDKNAGDADRTETGMNNESSSEISNADQTKAEDDNPLAPLARRLNKPIEAVEELIYVSVENDELPQLILDEPELLGDSVVERQQNAALIVLLVWDKCYGQSKMKVSDIKDIFSIMDISTSNTHRAWEKGYFQQTGKGAAATVRLRGPGEREGYSLLRDLLEENTE